MSTADPGCTLSIKAIPGAPRSEVCGWLGEHLKVKVQAPAVEGRANEALLRFLAEALGIPPRSVSLLRGDTARLKVVRIAGLGSDEVRRRLGV